MSFTSVEFILLVTAAVVLYYLVPKRFQWIVLLAANYIFYLCGGVLLTGYLLAATVCTYAAGLALERLNVKKGQLDKNLWKRRKKSVAAAALIFNFGMLYVVKYLDGTLEVLSQIAGRPVTQINILVPLGISYYIFQSCGYVIDCYRGKYAVEHNIGHYALFVSFFPQMVQGPISRFRDLGGQLTAQRNLDFENLRSGIQLMLWGYFKKLIIADRAGVLVNTVFDNYDSYSGSIIALAVFFYCIQLYCDFSGGIDTARGVAHLFGVNLAENFRRPIFADSVADYWRRWHITLGSWMRDYVFYPISLSKPFMKLGKFSRKHFSGVFGKILPTSLATFIVYLIIGIWHGSDPKYIVYGFWNGIIITASLLLEQTFERNCRRLGIDRKSTGWRIFRIVRTCLLIFIGRYLTRADSLGDAVSMMKATALRFQPGALLDGTALQLGVTAVDYLVISAGVAVLLTVEFLQERGLSIRETLAQKRAFVQYLGILIPVAAVLLLGVWFKGDVSVGFIYMQF
ncbi:MAG: MBOAT family O-acyltransferase [Anaerovoracaceae bacterium]